MLHILNRQKQFKKETSNILGNAAGFSPIPIFDPLTLPGLLSAYYMNLTTDIPPGSIDTNYITGNWNNMIDGTKILNCIATTQIGSINGFKSPLTYIPPGFTFSVPFTNNAHDITDPLTDFGVLFGFRYDSVNPNPSNPNFLIAIKNNNNDLALWIALRGGKLEIFMSNDPTGAGINAIALTAGNGYGSGLHVCYANFIQSQKKVELYTELEFITASQPALVTKNLISTTPFYWQIGNWWNRTFPGYLSLGDIFFFYPLLSVANINSLIDWEKSRIGI